MFIDLHCDTISFLHAHPERGTLRKNSLSVDLEKLKCGHSLAQVFALFVDRQKADDPAAQARRLLQRFQASMAANEDRIALALCGGDVLKHQAMGKLSAILSLEEGAIVKGDLETLYDFYRSGVRMMTLTWNYPNEIGFPNHQYAYQNEGLTSFGRTCVEAMNHIGMIVDVSHLSDRGFDDVAAISSVPFVASHSNSRSMTAHSRNLTDEQIRVLADQGGVMGINFACQFLGASPVSQIDDMLRHIRHIYQVGGIEVLALGSDYDGIKSPVEIADFSQMQKLPDALQKDGFTPDQIDRLCYKNCLRVLDDCLGRGE